MKFTIYKRLIFGYSVIMVLVVFMGTYGIFKLNHLNNLSQTITLGDINTMRLTEQLSEKILSQVSFAKKYSISMDSDFYEQFEQIEKYIVIDMKNLEPLLDTPEKREKLAKAKVLYNRYIAIFKKETVLTNTSQKPNLVITQEHMDKLVDRIQKELKIITTLARIDKDKKMQLSSQIVSNVLTIFTIMSGLAILLGFFISFFNTNSINRPILLLQDKTKEISRGKFKKILNIASPPEIKELADHFNIMCERLQELDEMKQDFISHISHELRTPLTVIKEASSMLMAGVYADVQEKQQELLKIMYEDCERLINSVNRILDLSRMEAKMMEYRFEKCNILLIIQKIVLKMLPLAQKKNISLEFKHPSEFSLVNMDQERIGQVVENLVENALKYTPEGGRVLIDAYLLNNDNQRNVRVSISDNGQGIAEEDIDRIFEKFRRIEKGKETIRGTGLGLSICKHIISVHGGKIWAKSKLGKGSCFFFTLPVS
jgi:two-component system sensor histidine kinase GlrK